MRFFVDANLSPRLAERLRREGHDAVAVGEVGLADASDDDILNHAIAGDRVIISHDTDFGSLLAFRRLSAPSFILIRSSDPLTPDEQADLIVDNLDIVSDDLAAGAIIVFARGRLRSRRLPLQ